jgi:hypothetical protein
MGKGEETIMFQRGHHHKVGVIGRVGGLVVTGSVERC